jgi:hypothetical protein
MTLNSKQKWVLSLFWFIVISRFALIATSLRNRWLHWDFTWYYLPALMLKSGVDPYTTDLRPFAQSLGLDTDMIVAHDTPTLLLLFEPLSRFGVNTAYWIWMAASCLALILGVGVLLRKRSFKAITLCIVAAIMYEPVSVNFYLSQTQFLILCLLALTLWSLECGRERTAGLLVALSTLLRAYPIVMAGYFVARERWLALQYLVLGLVVGGFATVALAPASVHWIAAVLVFRDSEFRNTDANLSLSAAVWRLLTLNGRHVWRGVEIPIVLVDLGLLVASLRAAYSAGRERGFGLWVVTMVLLSPVAWIHYMVLLLIPFSQIVPAAMTGTLAPRIARSALASYLLITVVPFVQMLTSSAVLGEYAFLSLALAYLSAYWFAIVP